MKTPSKRELEPAVVIARGGHRLTIEIDDFDAQLIQQSLKLTSTLRPALHELLGTPGAATPVSDEREAALIHLLEVEK